LIKLRIDVDYPYPLRIKSFIYTAFSIKTSKLKERRADMFTFIERKWCFTIQKPSKDWVKADDNIALLRVTSYEEWWCMPFMGNNRGCPSSFSI